MPPTSKIHSALSALLDADVRAEGAQPEIRIIVKHKPFIETMTAAAAVGGVLAVGRRYSRVFSGASMTATPEAIRILANRPDVDQIWLDEPVHTLLDVSVPLIGAPTLWKAGWTGKGILVGVVDTGIDPDHPDFAGRIVASKDLTGEADRDNNGHGTHVAGIAAGSGAQSAGKYKGVAPECSLIIAKVLKSNGGGMMSDVIAGLEYVLDQHAQVVNLSLGGGSNCDGTDALSTACDNLWDQGVVVCVAVGNAGPAAGTVNAPGCAKKPITVGATDKQDAVASFSSRGPTTDGRVKPDLCFPGASIHSCRAKGTSIGDPIDDYYTTASGTSMATPHASGACALLLQAQPALKPQQIKDALMATARDLLLDENTEGHGRADLPAAYQHISASTPPPTPPEPPTPEPPPPTLEPPTPPEPTPLPPAPGNGCRDLIASFFKG